MMESSGFLPVFRSVFSIEGNWDLRYDLITKSMNLQPTKMWKIPERVFRRNFKSTVDAENRRKKGEEFSLASWRYEFYPKSYISLEESFREVLHVFYPKRQTFKHLLKDGIAWETSIFFAIYLTNFAQEDVTEDYFEEPILVVPLDIIDQLTEMQTDFGLQVYSINKFEAYEEGYSINGWKHCCDTYTSTYKEWNIIKKT